MTVKVTGTAQSIRLRLKNNFDKPNPPPLSPGLTSDMPTGREAWRSPSVRRACIAFVFKHGSQVLDLAHLCSGLELGRENNGSIFDWCRENDRWPKTIATRL